MKFAGSVELFEYLYKYLSKGSDRASYDVTMDDTVLNELRERQRGRYLCATDQPTRAEPMHLLLRAEPEPSLNTNVPGGRQRSCYQASAA